MQATTKRLIREHDERAWLAWHIEALARTKKMPKLQDMQSTGRRRRTPSKPQSPEVLFASMKAMFLAFGGDPKELAKTNGR